MRIGLRYPVEVGLVGDSRGVLQEPLPRKRKRNKHRGFLKDAQDGMKDWWKIMVARGTGQDKPMKPQVVAWELGKRLSHTSDRILRFRHYWDLSMANGLPYRVAAKIAYPDRQWVALVGDGGFSMLMAEFITCVKVPAAG